MTVKHAWPGIFHHRPDPFSHLGFVAMYGALSALWLVLPEGAFLKTSDNIVQEVPALGAQPLFGAMLSVAKDFNHCLGGPAFLPRF